MRKSKLSSGVVHELPEDLENKLLACASVVASWEDITPLARNEWICWVEDAKKVETRISRIERAIEELANGKRRPCCWPSCKHRNKN